MPPPLEPQTVMLSYIYGNTDPAAVFALVFCIPGLQLLAWCLARHSSDIEWWRAAALAAIVTVISIVVLNLLGLGEGLRPVPIVSAFVGCAFATWLGAGLLYDMETWQRVTLSLSAPVVGTIAWFLGVLLRNGIIESTMTA